MRARVEKRPARRFAQVSLTSDVLPAMLMLVLCSGVEALSVFPGRVEG